MRQITGTFGFSLTVVQKINILDRRRVSDAGLLEVALEDGKNTSMLYHLEIRITIFSEATTGQFGALDFFSV